MNAPTSKSHSVTCPICHRSSAVEPVETLHGLFICPHCRSNLVISWSGHYVRDPFATLQHQTLGQVLRRQSHPLARLGRDLGLRQCWPFLALMGSAIILGLTLVTLDQSQPADFLQPEPIEQSRQ